MELSPRHMRKLLWRIQEHGFYQAYLQYGFLFIGIHLAHTCGALGLGQHLFQRVKNDNFTNREL